MATHAHTAELRSLSRSHRLITLATMQARSLENKATKLNSLFAKLDAALKFDDTSADVEAAQRYWRLNGLYGAVPDKGWKSPKKKRPKSAKARKTMQEKADLRRARPVQREGNPDYFPPTAFARTLRGGPSGPEEGVGRERVRPMSAVRKRVVVGGGESGGAARPQSAPAGRRGKATATVGRVRPGTAGARRKKKGGSGSGSIAASMLAQTAG